MTTTSQDVLKSQVCIKRRQAAEMLAQPNRQDGDRDMQELTARNIQHTIGVMMKDVEFLDKYHSGNYEFVQVAV
jgi:hypothetical protein